MQKSTVLGTPLMILLSSISIPLLPPLAHAIYEFKNVRHDSFINEGFFVFVFVFVSSSH